MMSIAGIYKIENILNSKVYIGKSQAIKDRWKQHKDDLNRGVHINSDLQFDWNSYGPDFFKFEILEECSDCDLTKLESDYVHYFKAIERGYNSASFPRFTFTVKRIGELETVRQRLGLSKEDIAQKIGVTMRTYQRWTLNEGKPSYNNVQRIDRFLKQKDN